MELEVGYFEGNRGREEKMHKNLVKKKYLFLDL